ncbi:MAG: hypothetical protein NTX01_04880, partial [Candidatus Omnitrophica bacterium]|nr:hypothetical protein [Candidatus Omnitrophota bacterium]
TWSSSNTYIWQTSSADKGAVSITCEVKDPSSNLTSKTISLRILDPTIQEILNKVADNYALINDKKMDITITSKFSNDNLNLMIYTRQYFKKPDKQRTETFSSPDRPEANKTEIQISVGTDTYLIDPKTKARAHQNLATEYSLTQAQLNQMDEVYQLQDFINVHAITRIDTPQDLANGLVNLEIIPRAELGFYSKLRFQIDYFKGLKTRSLTYIKENNLDKLKESIEITDSVKFSNNAYLPTKQIKTLYFDEGNLMMTFDLVNTQINTGLADYLFDPER